jgi:hypothetical protein
MQTTQLRLTIPICRVQLKSLVKGPPNIDTKVDFEDAGQRYGFPVGRLAAGTTRHANIAAIARIDALPGVRAMYRANPTSPHAAHAFASGPHRLSRQRIIASRSSGVAIAISASRGVAT